MILQEDHSEDSGLERISHTFLMALNPALSKTVLSLKKFEELPTKETSYRLDGLILDVDGTITTPGSKEISPDVMQKLAEIKQQIAVCIFGRDMWQFRQLGIPVVRNVAPKPDPTSFIVAAQLYLRTTKKGKTIDLKKCAMVGDDFSTDGGCIGTGMQFIYVKPRIDVTATAEPFIKRATRRTSNTIAEFQESLRKVKAGKEKK